MNASENYYSQKDLIAPFKVLIVEDQEILSIGLKYAFQPVQEITVVGIAPDGPTAVDMAQKLKPDIILMDISLPGFSGIEATAKLKSTLESRILMFSSHEEEEFVAKSLKAGADGYCLKNSPTAIILDAIQSVMAGEIWIDETIQKLHPMNAARQE